MSFTKWWYKKWGKVYIVKDEDGNRIADVITEANARLIAAAPDMYEALKNVCKECFHDSVCGKSKLSKLCNISKLLKQIEGDK